jgi:hypothetical protein
MTYEKKLMVYAVFEAKSTFVEALPNQAENPRSAPTEKRAKI